MATLTVYASTSNATVRAHAVEHEDVDTLSELWPHAHDADGTDTEVTTMRLYTGGDEFNVLHARVYYASPWFSRVSIYRSFLFFDTSNIPALGTITGATLHLYATDKNDYYTAYSDHGIQVQSGAPTHPSDPVVAADFDCTNYSGNYGSLSMDDITIDQYNSLALDTSIINTSGTTKLCIRESSRDIADDYTINSGDVYGLEFYSEAKGGDYRPKLVIEYDPIPEVSISVGTSLASYGNIIVDPSVPIATSTAISVEGSRQRPGSTSVLVGPSLEAIQERTRRAALQVTVIVEGTSEAVPSPLNPFFIDGLPAKALGLRMLPSTQLPMLPDTRDRYVEVPGMHGWHTFESNLTSRRIKLDLFVTGCKTPEQLQTRAHEIASHFLDDEGNPKDVDLRMALDPTRVYTVRYSGFVPLERLIGATKGYFTLPLEQADPFVTSGQQTDTMEVSSVWQTCTIESEGDYRTPVRITVTNNGPGSVRGFTLICRQEKSD